MSQLAALLQVARTQPGRERLGAALVDALMAALEPLQREVRGLRPLRGLVHSRPSGSYAGLVVQPPTEDPSLAPSTTAWREVERVGVPVLLDVKRGSVASAGVSPQQIATSAGGAFQSRAALLGREVTHVLALPLRDAGGALSGMVALELSALSAVGRPLPWEPVLPELEALCVLAGPWLAAAPAPVAARAPEADPLLPVVGARMSGIIALLRVFAAQGETILISGPTGAGKSRLARWCHARSSRAGGPFEVLDLLTITDDMQQGELFGWRRGAFTGAVRDHAGAVERAEGGTLFLDEIDKLSLRSQAALLQLLEERRYRPLGATGAARAADVRFLVGTNADLRASVAAGRFREDLYYRINVLPVTLPGLAERRDEIPAWAAFMLGRRQSELGLGGLPRLSPEAEARLSALPWPGNLRELDNTVRRAAMIAVAERGPADLVLQASDVERALLLEQGRRGEGPLKTIEQGASALAALAVARAEQGRPLDLELCAAFEGLTLAAAARMLGSREAAWAAFGRESMVSARNHHKAWRRASAHVAALCAALGEPLPPGLDDDG